jgi:LPXTG-motif cell wall-anchored protein
MVLKKHFSVFSPAGFRKLAGLGAALLLMLWTPVLAAQVTVSAELDSSRIMIGDQVRLQLTVTHKPAVKVQKIDWTVLDEQDKIEVVAQGRLDTVSTSGDIILTQELILTSFDSGYHYIPPIPVSYIAGDQSGTVQTGRLALEVSTFPIKSDTAGLAPIKTIIGEPLRIQDLLPFLLLIVGVALLGMVVGYFLRRRRKKEAPPEPEVMRPAHEIAMKQLSELRDRKLWQQGAVKEYHSELTHIVREYLENRFEVRALESTTEETMTQLGDAVESTWREKLRELLQTADLVKFAKATPPATFHDDMLERAEAFVRATKREEIPEEGALEEQE